MRRPAYKESAVGSGLTGHTWTVPGREDLGARAAPEAPRGAVGNSRKCILLLNKAYC